MQTDETKQTTTGGVTLARDGGEFALERHWHGKLTAETIERVAAMIRHRLEGKAFAIASAMYADSKDARLELRTGCRFEPDWTDGSTEAVRVMRHTDGRPWLAFSAGHYFWSFNDGDSAAFSFDYDGVSFEFRAPAGHLHRHCFRVERPGESDT